MYRYTCVYDSRPAGPRPPPCMMVWSLACMIVWSLHDPLVREVSHVLKFIDFHCIFIDFHCIFIHFFSHQQISGAGTYACVQQNANHSVARKTGFKMRLASNSSLLKND